jgi:C4-dicarboxylate-specific signal transduction histidine kinase
MSVADADMAITTVQMGLHGETGVLVAGALRAGFPAQTERLLLSVAANQATIGLHEARLLSEQRRVADELDRRVAQRTAELAATNEELRGEIAERERAEERLRWEEHKLKRSEALLAEAQRLSSTGSFSWRVTTDDVTFSEQTYRMYDFAPSGPVTLGMIASRIHPGDMPLFLETIDVARGLGSDLDCEYRLQMSGGSVKHMHLVAHATRDKDGQLEYVGAIQDVTQRRLSEDAIETARSELAHVARVATVSALTASIAHEVNQPLSGIITNAGTCLRMLDAEPPNVDGARETARRALRDGHRAADVIKRLRDMFTRREFALESMDLNEATREVVALSLSDLQKNRVTVHLELTDPLPLVMGDRVQLQQVILNLLRNASEAMAAVEDRPRELVVRTERDDAGVRLTARDAGAGLDRQSLDKLFDAFYTTKHGGMGIGLSVSRSIIERHHGRMWAEPNDGPGATFAFSIPCSGASA